MHTSLPSRRVIAGAAAAAMLAVPALAGATVKGHSAAAATVSAKKASNLGNIIVAANGHTLYEFDKDKKNHSDCTGACTKTWIPYTVSGTATAGSGVNSKLLTTFTSGGKKQVEYNGHPLYTYVHDTKAGQLNGQELEQFGGDWYVIGAAKGKPILCQAGVSCSY